MFDFMPEQASSWAADVDFINNVITWISVASIIGITVVMLYFAFRYRRGEDQSKVAFIPHNTTLETVWTVVPSIICVVIFYFGFTTYREMRTPTANVAEVNVTAFKWGWRFEYPNGRKTNGELVVPLGQSVRLVMTSEDVIHSFFIPAMRVKEDVYRGNFSYLWFTPIKLGTFHIFCAEYCGTSHSAMRAELKVVSPEEYADFLLDRTSADALAVPPAERGATLFKQNGCTSCHAIDGSVLVGPSLKGLFFSGERELSDGSKVKVDENYVQQSIWNPQSQIVKGFENQKMNSFKGTLSADQINDIIAYLKTLK